MFCRPTFNGRESTATMKADATEFVGGADFSGKVAS